MGVWTDHVVPRAADRSLRSDEIGSWRDEACAPLRGKVLELGFGGGLNVRWYPPEVTSVVAVEPSDVGWRLSEQRRAASVVPVERRGLDGQEIAERDASYDAVLSTFTLCTIPDAALALAEAARVLRPGGVLSLLEHGAAPDASVAAWQHRLEPLQRRVAGGCHLTRDVPALVTDAGFEITRRHADYLEGPRVSRPWTHLYLVTAVRAT
jgi:ubiquinone/menaquinone biosynthesis C-methylase UbiE